MGFGSILAERIQHGARLAILMIGWLFWVSLLLERIIRMMDPGSFAPYEWLRLYELILYGLSFLFFLPIGSTTRLKRKPVITWMLIIVNVFCFVFYRNTDNYMLSPDHHIFMTMFTYQFAHANIRHLLGNMLFLYAFGRLVEDRLGRVWFLAAYLFCGVISGIVFLATFTYAVGLPMSVVGASGAISGIMAIYLGRCWFAKIRFLPNPWFWFGWWKVEGSPLIFVALYMVEDLWNGLLLFSERGREYLGNIGYWGHIGGYLAGGYLVLRLGLIGKAKVEHILFQSQELIEQSKFDLPMIRKLRAYFGMFPTQNKFMERVLGLLALQPSQRAVLCTDQRLYIESLAQTDLPKAARKYAEFYFDTLIVMKPELQLELTRELIRQALGHKAVLIMGPCIQHPARYGVSPVQRAEFLWLCATTLDKRMDNLEASRTYYEALQQEYPLYRNHHKAVARLAEMAA